MILKVAGLGLGAIYAASPAAGMLARGPDPESLRQLSLTALCLLVVILAERFGGEDETRREGSARRPR